MLILSVASRLVHNVNFSMLFAILCEPKTKQVDRMTERFGNPTNLNRAHVVRIDQKECRASD